MTSMQDLYEALRRGPATKEDLMAILNITPSMKGSRAMVHNYLCKMVKKGEVEKEGGVYTLVREPSRRIVREAEIDGRVRKHLAESGWTTISEIADAVGSWPQNVRESLKRLGAQRRKSGRRVLWNLPEESE